MKSLLTDAFLIDTVTMWEKLGKRKGRKRKEGIAMVIYGVALLAACYIVGVFLGDVLGALLGVAANVGGVGFAMLFLIIITAWLQKKGWFPEASQSGIKFWAAMYIPIVVAMSSIQNVYAALSGGVVAFLGAVITVVVGFLLIPPLSNRKGAKAVSSEDQKGNK